MLGSSVAEKRETRPMTNQPMLISEPEREEEEKQASFWSTVGRSLLSASSVTGRTLAHLGQQAGQTVAEAYQAIDPDVRRHVAQLPLMALTYLSPGFRALDAKPDDGHRPLLFVHGLGGHSGNFVGMQLYFAAMGRKRTYSVQFGRLKELEAMAEHLQHCIHTVCARNELDATQSIDIVAHSMGGIVTRLALEDSETARYVAHVVTLGTPHKGTHMARFAATQHIQSLRPNSSVLEKLEQQVPWEASEERPPLFALWSHADVLILPAEGASLEGAINLEMSNYTHYTYLLHPQAWQKVYQLF